MSDQMPEPQAETPPRAPGGVDADLSESDVGAASEGQPPVTPDEPLSAQTDQSDVPPEIQEGETTDDEPDSAEESAEESTTEPSA